MNRLALDVDVCTYVQNDPLTFVDPSGLDSDAPLQCAAGKVPMRDAEGKWQCVGIGTISVTVTHDPFLDWFLAAFNGRRIDWLTTPQLITTLTTDQQERVTLAVTELKNRLGKNEGDNPCAAFFGGRTVAEKALNELSFRAGALADGGLAHIDGNTVTIDQNNGFFGTGQPSIRVSQYMRARPPNNGTLSANVQFAAFILAHELGHKTGSLKDDNGLTYQSIINNGMAQQACFSNFIRYLN